MQRRPQLARNLHCCITEYSEEEKVTLELQHEWFWSSNLGNIPKDACVKWMKLGCVVPAFP